MKLFTSLSILIYFFLLTPAEKEIRFTVYHGGKSIGTMKITRKQSGGKVVRELKTDTDANIMVASIHAESELSVLSDDEVLTMGIAYRYGNHGANDIHANIVRLGSKYQVERNGVVVNIDVPKIEFCMVDMYFKEPKGLTQVYSSMHGDFLPVRKLSETQYEVGFPDGNTTIYIYKRGEIDAVESNLPVGKIISKRTW